MRSSPQLCKYCQLNPPQAFFKPCGHKIACSGKKIVFFYIYLVVGAFASCSDKIAATNASFDENIAAKLKFLKLNEAVVLYSVQYVMRVPGQ